MDWTESALCAQIGGEYWFPEQGQGGSEAKLVCDSCPVAQECLDFAIENGEVYGIWGGLGRAARNRIAREQGKRVA